MFWFISGFLIIIGTIFSQIFRIEEHRTTNDLYSGMIAICIMLLVGNFFIGGLVTEINSELCKTDYEVTQVENVVPLSEKYDFGVGEQHGRIIYVYLEENEDGICLQKMIGNKAYFTPSEDTYIEHYEGTFHSSWTNFFSYTCLNDYYVLHCPEEKIATNYVVTVKN